MRAISLTRARKVTALTIAAQIVILAAMIGFWQWASGRIVKEFFVSKPSDVAHTLSNWFSTGYAYRQFGTTLYEMLLGLLIGAVLGILLGVGLGLNPYFWKVFDPFFSALYSIPNLALAPLFIIWFGLGLKMVLVMVSTVVFFVVFWNACAGARDVDGQLIEIFRVMGATRGDLIRKLVVPGAVGHIFVGLKLAVPLALAGAILGELLGSNRGGGYVLKQASQQFDIAGEMGALCIFLVMGWFINSLLNWVEGRLLRWRVESVGGVLTSDD
jgi:NitT/TauT family transport system permease protein